MFSASTFVQEILGKPHKCIFLTAWRSEQSHYLVAHCLLSNKHLLWRSPALSLHRTFTAHRAVAITAFYLQYTLTYLLSQGLSGEDAVIFWRKAKYVFEVVCDLGQGITAAKVFFHLAGCHCAFVPHSSDSLVEQNTEHKTFPHIPLLWLPWGLKNAIKLLRLNRLSESSEMSVHLFLSQGKWQGIQIIPDSLHWQPHTKINELLQPRGCKHTL